MCCGERVERDIIPELTFYLIFNIRFCIRDCTPIESINSRLHGYSIKKISFLQTFQFMWSVYHWACVYTRKESIRTAISLFERRIVWDDSMPKPYVKYLSNQQTVFQMFDSAKLSEMLMA